MEPKSRRDERTPAITFVPTGLTFIYFWIPSFEKLGYLLPSLRDLE